MKPYPVILLVLLSFFSQEALSQKWKEYRQAGQDAYTSKKFALADSLYRLAMADFVKTNNKDSVYADLAGKIGVSCQFIEKMDEAQKWLEISFKEFKKAGNKSLSMGSTCNTLAVNYYRQGRFAEAEPLFLEAIEIRKQLLGIKSDPYGSTLNNLAALYNALGKYDKVEPLYNEALAIAEARQGKKSEEYVMALSNLGNFYMDVEKFLEAEKLLLEAKALKESIYGKKDPEYATTCMALGSTYELMGKYDLALTTMIEAKEVIEQSVGKKHYYYAVVCSNIAGIYSSLGLYSMASDFYDESLGLLKQIIGKEHPAYLTTCMGVVEMHVLHGEYFEAEKLCYEVLQVRKRVLGKEHPEYAKSCMFMGRIYHFRGFFSKAEEYYLEALNIERGISTLSTDGSALAISSLGELYRENGFYKKAEALCKESIQLLEKGVIQDYVVYSVAVFNLGNVYTASGQREKALEQYQKAIKIFEDNGLTGHVNYVLASVNLAGIYAEMGELDKAEGLLLPARERMAIVIGTLHPEYARTCSKLGELYLLKKDFERSEKYFDEALDIRKKVLGASSPEYATSLSNSSVLYYKTGNYKETSKRLIEAATIMNRRLVFELPLLSEAERLETTISKSEASNAMMAFGIKYLDIEPSYAAAMFDQCLFSKSLIFASTQRMKKQIMSSSDTSLINDYERWKKAKTDYLKLVDQSAQNQTLVAELDKMEENINVMEKKLSAKSFDFAKSSDIKVHSWKDLQAVLGKNEVAIEIIRIENKMLEGLPLIAYAVLFVTKETKNQPAYVLLSNGEDLDGKYFSYYKSSLTLKKEDKSSYKAYWEPIAEKLKQLNPKGFDKIYFAPDGVYHQISLAGLFDTNDKKYFGEKFSVQIIGSCRDLLEQDQKSVKISSKLKSKEAVLFGYPLYDAENLSVNSGDETRSAQFSSVQNALGTQVSWPLLPGTKNEVLEIEKALTSKNLNAKVYLSEAATEEEFKALQDPLLLHVATHGYFIKKYNAPLEDLKDAESHKAMSDPLKRCGLAFSGCADPKEGMEDGLLTAAEAMNLHLEKTELVVLSACETGLGEIVNGEGVYGLQRAFQQAGAKCIVMSLWKVSDEATELLMTEFYAHLSNGKDKRDAFRLAQMVLKAKFPHPYYWAAFVIVGN